MATRWTMVIVVVVVVGIATAFVAFHYRPDEASLRIGGEEFRTLVADNPAELVRGLSGLPSLDEHTVMLFVFPAAGHHGIWMKEMRFAIDILWLDENGYVVHIQENATPDSYPRVFVPEQNARYVIEMNAGVVNELGIHEGQQVFFKQ